VRADGSIGSLFVNARARLPIGVWLPAEHHYRPSGLAYRPGWHATEQPYAPHLSLNGRAWFAVDIGDYQPVQRPAAQGGRWFLAEWMRIVGKL